MHTLDYLVILIFTGMVLLVGMAFTRSGASMKSFFAAGGSVPWWLSGLSLFMSFFSAGTFVVWGSIAYEYGWVAITIQWMMALSGFFIGWWIAPKWRETGALTVGAFIGRRFGSTLRNFYSVIFLLLSFVTTGAFLYPVAKLFNVSTGLSIEGSIVGLGLLILIYTAAGGLWAVIVTDVLQFVILFAAVLMVVPMALGRVGGWAGFTAGVPEGFFDLFAGEYTPWFMMAFLFYNTLFIGGNWAYVQRYTSVARPRDARRVGYLFGTLYLVSPVLWMLPAMVFRVVDDGLVDLANEGAFLLMCKEVLPRGMLGLMLGGMIFATASSVNTTLNISAAVFTNDIYLRWRQTAKEEGLMQVARISTAAFGILTILVALMVPSLGGIVEVVISVGAITGAPLFAPPIWALFSRRQTAWSIMFTTLVGLGINLFFKFVSSHWLDYSLSRGEEMLVGVMGPLLILAVFEGLLPRSKEVARPVPSIVLERTADSGQNRFAIRVLAWALLFTGILICFLGAISPNFALIVLLMGALILAIATFLLWQMKRL